MTTNSYQAPPSPVCCQAWLHGPMLIKQHMYTFMSVVMDVMSPNM